MFAFKTILKTRPQKLGYLPRFSFNSARQAFANINVKEEKSEKPKLKIIQTNSIGSNLAYYDYLPQRDIPLCMFKQPRSDQPKKKLITLKSQFFNYSSYKINFCCFVIRNKTLSHALNLLNADTTKGGKILREYLENYLKTIEKRRERQREKGIEQPVSEYRIIEAYVGKKNGSKRVNYRAKGKTDIIESSMASFTIKLEKLEEDDFNTEIVRGKADSTYAMRVRSYLFSNKANLRQLQAYSFVTTAKGRMYRKQQFKRLILHLQSKYSKENGLKLSPQLIEKHLVSKLGRTMTLVNQGKKDQLLVKENDKLLDLAAREITDYTRKEIPEDKTIESRQENFNKNYKKI